NELLIDGAADNTGNLRVAYNPPMDAVVEVKAESFQADAAYGHSGGGTVNVITRGGTNEFHGTLYEFNQNSAFNATPFFANKAVLVLSASALSRPFPLDPAPRDSAGTHQPLGALPLGLDRVWPFVLFRQREQTTRIPSPVAARSCYSARGASRSSRHRS